MKPNAPSARQRPRLPRLLLAGTLVIGACTLSDRGVTNPADVVQVVLTPPTITVTTGQTILFQAEGRNADGAARSVVVDWSATGGTINAGGQYTAGQTVGSFQVIASLTGGTLADTSNVTIVSTAGGLVLVGAGDIADCGSSGDEATATLLDGIAGTVFTAGDNAYSDGSDADFSQCYDPSWGRHKARTRPSPGNHDYHTTGAASYYHYYGANAGDTGKGYYSYDLGTWHVVSLNSNIDMDGGSPQETWLRADLAASIKPCTIAYWHHPRFSSGTTHGSESNAQPLWQALYDFNAEIVISGHEHNYERFAPQTPAGQADPAKGIREFVVGTGGVSHYDLGTALPNSEVSNGTTYGVLKLTLAASSYSWQFIPVAGGSFTDSGAGSCH